MYGLMERMEESYKLLNSYLELHEQYGNLLNYANEIKESNRILREENDMLKGGLRETEERLKKCQSRLKLTRAMINAKKVSVTDAAPEQIEKAKIDAKVYLEIMDFANWMKDKIEEYKRSKEV